MIEINIQIQSLKCIQIAMNVIKALLNLQIPHLLFIGPLMRRWVFRTEALVQICVC